MKVLALVSGGKDSCFSIMECQRQGHEVVALANLLPKEESTDDLDSWMYQTVGHQVVGALSECMGLPMFRRRIQGQLVDSGLIYRGHGDKNLQNEVSSSSEVHAHTSNADDEVEDLFALVAFAKQAMPGIQAVCSGAIASDYQRTRVESVCARLGLVSLAPLWHRPQAELVHAMIDSGISAILVKVAAVGLTEEKHLGKSLHSIVHYLHTLRRKYGSNICGEGGEYETLTLDCPAFRFGHLILDKWVSRSSTDGVAVLHPLAYHVEPKQKPDTESHAELIEVPDDWRFTGNRITDPIASEAAELARQEGAQSRVQLAVRSVGSYISVTAELEVQASKSQAEAAALSACLTTIGTALQTQGTNWDKVLYVHLFVPAMSAFAAANAVYGAFLPPVAPAARATVEPFGSASGRRAMRVDVLAVQPSEAQRVLHVQSISAWAPSCIGPYAQAVSHKGIVRFAGQIGLVPSTMAVIEGGLLIQTRRCLDSCQAVAVAMDCDLPKSMLFAAVFLSQEGSREATQNNNDDSPVAEAVHQELTSFLDGSQSDDGYSSDLEESGDNDNAQFVDGYLQAPEMPRRLGWRPLLSYLTMRNLPRGVLVEIQPTACDVTLVRQPGEANSDDEEEEESRNTRRHIPSGPVWRSWMGQLEQRDDILTESDSQVSARAQSQVLVSQGQFLQAQVWLQRGKNLEPLIERAQALVKSAGLLESAIVWVRIYRTPPCLEGQAQLGGLPVLTIDVEQALVAVQEHLVPASALLELFATADKSDSSIS